MTTFGRCPRWYIGRSGYGWGASAGRIAWVKGWRVQVGPVVGACLDLAYQMWPDPPHTSDDVRLDEPVAEIPSARRLACAHCGQVGGEDDKKCCREVFGPPTVRCDCEETT